MGSGRFQDEDWIGSWKFLKTTRAGSAEVCNERLHEGSVIKEEP
jgi:hypothetical protein